jgi:hypothetical protein
MPGQIIDAIENSWIINNLKMEGNSKASLEQLKEASKNILLKLRLTIPEIDWLNYVVNSFSVDAAELKLQHSKTYLGYLVLRMLASEQIGKAESLLKQHNLYDSDILMQESIGEWVEEAKTN